MSRKKKEHLQVTARSRAEIIMKVRAGYLTATEGAALLGISRKTYYKWENRALAGLLAGLEERKTGRPELPVHTQNETELQNRIEELEQEKELLKKQMEIKDLVYQLKLDEAKERIAPRSKRSKKKR